MKFQGLKLSSFLISFFFLKEIELVVNLGFEDSGVEDNDEYSVKNEIKNEILKEADIIMDSTNSENKIISDKREVCYVDEALEFKK